MRRETKICSFIRWPLAKVVEEIELIELLKKKINFFLFLRTNLIRLFFFFFGIFHRTFQRRFCISPWNFQALLGTLMLLVPVADRVRAESMQPL